MNLFHKIRGSLALVAMFFNTLICMVPLYLLVVMKLLLKGDKAQVALSHGLVRIAEFWITINNLIIALFSQIHWQVEGMDNLTKQQWYFVISNHQSWADILTLQRIFNRRIPMLKFFLKQELRKVPMLGDAWWALDFPFMKRHSREEIEKNPELKGTDLATTRAACEKFAMFPTSVMNFVEGTRFTTHKHDQQQSPYQYLLKPKAGGAAFTLGAMSGHLRTLLDVTIIYPNDVPRTLLAFLGGAQRNIQVIVQQHPIPDWASQGDYENDPVFRERFQQWMAKLWADKDALLASRRAA
ncbi:acyltransferase [Alcanivorax sp. 1008]|uniref:acyltransferase n=1 Tax=Alcanivorax sp. 1008 TaxID=2816853 RepID=UPI001DE185AD|nr:acyltransferase [Alcanivorax sp. 1008]MCC1497689.1 acyltransferase [Alcanivorax sp. 1008]